MKEIILAMALCLSFASAAEDIRFGGHFIGKTESGSDCSVTIKQAAKLFGMGEQFYKIITNTKDYKSEMAYEIYENVNWAGEPVITWADEERDYTLSYGPLQYYAWYVAPVSYEVRVGGEMIYTCKDLKSKS